MSQTKSSLIHLPNLLAATSPLLIILGTVVFPFAVEGSFVLYLSDMLPAWLILLTFLPSVFIYCLGQKKRYAILSILIGIATFGALIGEHIIRPSNSILLQNVQVNYQAKVDKFDRINRHYPLNKMERFDERYELGFYLAGLGLLMFPITLIAPKYKLQQLVSRDKKTVAS
ncbi:hypothetical protein QTV43_000628 [Vibrio vulnificus]|nr:hypothetical protein [Vibrio vulnificus]